MPSKKQIYEIVAMQLSGGVPQRSSKFTDPRPVYAVMDTLRDRLVYDFLTPQIYNEHFVSSSYIFTYDTVPVLFNATTNRYYSDFPVKMLTLPRDMQVYQIAPAQDVSSTFVRLSNQTEWMFKDNAAIELQGNVGYYADNNTATYFRINPLVQSVLMRLVTAGQSIADDDFYIGNDLMDKLIQGTFALLAPMANKQQDMSNNNNG